MWRCLEDYGPVGQQPNTSAQTRGKRSVRPQCLLVLWCCSFQGFSNTFFGRIANEQITAADAYGDPVLYINSSTVMVTAQAYFGCPSIVGAQLEDQGGSGSANSHWDYRLFLVRQAKDTLEREAGEVPG